MVDIIVLIKQMPDLEQVKVLGSRYIDKENHKI